MKKIYSTPAMEITVIKETELIMTSGITVSSTDSQPTIKTFQLGS